MEELQTSMFEDNPEYEAFEEKFKPKKTTDDCYTPPYIYDCILEWARKEYDLGDRPIVRPFYPGGDYQNFDYPENCAVVDNPPFSILSKILEWYTQREIDYFLFAPALTVLSVCAERANAVITDSSIIYENGANVSTAFVTNMGDYKIHVSAQLHDLIKTTQEIARREKKVELPKYVYPPYVLTSAIIQKIASKGQELRIKKEDCFFIRSLDSQKKMGKNLFGSGFLLSERAAAERAAAERAAAERAAAERAKAVVWELSEREQNIIREMSGYWAYRYNENDELQEVYICPKKKNQHSTLEVLP